MVEEYLSISFRLTPLTVLMLLLHAIEIRSCLHLTCKESKDKKCNEASETADEQLKSFKVEILQKSRSYQHTLTV